jgi:hypothetical protein
MNRIRIGRSEARSERRWPGGALAGTARPGIARATGARAGRAFRKAGRDMMAGPAGAYGWLSGR